MGLKRKQTDPERSTLEQHLAQVAGNLTTKADEAGSASDALAYAQAAAALVHARRDSRYPFHSSA